MKNLSAQNIFHSFIENFYHFINIFIYEGSFPIKGIYTFSDLMSICMLIMPYYDNIFSDWLLHKLSDDDGLSAKIHVHPISWSN